MDKSCAADRVDIPGSEEPQATSDGDSQNNTADAVLVCSRDGTICNLLRGPDALMKGLAKELPGSPVESFWPDEQALMVRDNIKRTLRSREIHSVEFEDSSLGAHYEFLFVAQGQDR